MADEQTLIILVNVALFSSSSLSCIYMYLQWAVV